MKKKAQLAIPFHWVFILIAGAIILLFFVSIVFKQKTVAEQKLSATLIADIEEIFVGAASGDQETVHPSIEVPKTEFEFICDEETGYSEYSIKGTGIHKEIPVDIIFSPDLVKGKILILWSLPWSMPFRIDNFLLVSSPSVRYVLVYDDPINLNQAKGIKFDMPEQLAVDDPIPLSQLPSIVNKGHYKIKFIFVGIEPDSIPDLSLPSFIERIPAKDVSAIAIVFGARPYIQFYEYDEGFKLAYEGSDKGRPPYISSMYTKDIMLYAAIFAENAGYYRCAIKKLLKRQKLVTNIHLEKTEKLIDYYQGTDTCDLWYPEDDFFSLISIVETCLGNLESSECSDIFEYAEKIRIANDVVKGKGCPLVY